MKIEILKAFGVFKEGETLEVETDKNGTPASRYWRRRFRDCKIDNSFRPVKTAKKKKTKPSESE